MNAALAAGAAAAVVRNDFERMSRQVRDTSGGLLIRVDDPVAAMGGWPVLSAIGDRRLGDRVAVTGSVGKTTTKQLIAHLLRPGGRHGLAKASTTASGSVTLLRGAVPFS